ncbi:ABC transporter permease [Weissella koreensis]|uniref:ABC transporter permease n=1 Tax=Weissella koreensis TaxID=165096 RepID=A0A7H1MMP0_9LACO|nr:ABC transporter permease [Weissella koreensis]AEJ23900.1 spermidine/putrescine ABC transporter permease [Weissella koreensis KACC 15510]AVH75523.1 ABC transporter permease [Weissella koreensis]EJF34503.1 spermidine/putrescine ABC superfamily ATP binding cassette transporter, membrane protein [Weissella koreensis KCTC 3621]MCZ9311577.1 ABC transporter permease [Weissella koreensis]QGN20745.1 ABC transporter permease subunit [Weissella koreensis]
MKKIKIGRIYLILVFILMYAPILYLIVFAFNQGDQMSRFTGFSLRHFQDMFADHHLVSILINTFILAFLSSILATLIGTFGALGIYQIRKPSLKNLVLSLNNILMVSPDVIIGASFLILFTLGGITLGFGSVLLAHIAFSIPIVVLLVLPKLNEMDTALIRAAQDLGANSYQVLSRVVLPYSWPGIIAGFFMAITYSLDDFAVTFFVTGNGFSTLSVEIYARARHGIDLSINALSAVMFLFSLVLVVIYYFITNPKKHKGGLKIRRRSTIKQHGGIQ